MIPPQATPKDIADAFVKVSFQEERDGDPLFEQWVDQASAKHSSPDLLLSKVLQKLYPNHSLVMTRDLLMNLLAFPQVYVQPLSPSELVTNLIFVPLPRNSGPVPGALVNSVEFGGFRVAWSNYEFIVYIAKWPSGFGVVQQYFILHDGVEDPIRDMLLSAGLWQDQLHQEIWVFNQGWWQKDRGLWQAIQSASWDDVILEADFKSALQKDVFGFFSARETYKKLSLPWKRGLILHGPPGNGKTISIKVIMKTCSDLGYSPMYVKSFKSWMGEEGSMAEVFAKARQNSPCVVILEDLDSLINDQNRSFFLNELDGLSGNDGLLVIGTTNHFDRLDPGLSTRPSRFDRKYLFDDPNRAARLLYTQYWQGKLESNDAVSFPDSLAREVADTTQSFSFAYLKEAFVSALVILLTDQEDGKDTTFEIAIKQQIKTLRKQLDKGTIDNLASIGLNTTPILPSAASQAALQSGATSSDGRSVHHLLDALSRSSGGPVYTATPSTAIDPRNADIRAALDRIAQGGSPGARWM